MVSLSPLWSSKRTPLITTPRTPPFGGGVWSRQLGTSFAAVVGRKEGRREAVVEVEGEKKKEGRLEMVVK